MDERLTSRSNLPKNLTAQTSNTRTRGRADIEDKDTNLDMAVDIDIARGQADSSSHSKTVLFRTRKKAKELLLSAVSIPFHLRVPQQQGLSM